MRNHRIGYVVAPNPLIPALTSAKWLPGRETATLEEETLAEFISCGMMTATCVACVGEMRSADK